MELPRMPSPFKMLRVRVLIVFTWTVQSRRGVKKTPKYLMEVDGVIVICDVSGS